MKTTVSLESLNNPVYPEVELTQEKLQLTSIQGVVTICNLEPVNNVEPEVFILEPIDNQIVYGTVNVRIAAIDPDRTGRLTKLEYKVDDLTFIEVQVTPNKAIDRVFEVPNVTSGNHSITVQVTDDRGGVANASTNFVFNRGDQTQVSFVPDNIASGRDIQINITNGLPNTTYSVSSVQGPVANVPPNGVLDASGSSFEQFNTSVLPQGNYVWRFLFAGGVTKDVSLSVERALAPVMVLSAYNIVENQSTTITLTDGGINVDWAISGTAGVTGTLTTDGQGEASLTVTPSSSGTIIVTNPSNVALSKSVVVATSTDALLEVNPPNVVVGASAIARIINSVEGYSYDLSGCGVTGTILITSDGTGSKVIAPTQSGTLVATRNTQELQATINIVDPAYSPQLRVRAGTTDVTNRVQVPVSEVLNFTLTGCKPNEYIDKIVVGATAQEVFFKNIGGIAYMQEPDSQPAGATKLQVSGTGTVSFSFKPQSYWPFTDEDSSTLAPANLAFKLRTTDGKDSNVIQVQWARTHTLKGVNRTQQGLVGSAANNARATAQESASYYSTVVDTSVTDELLVVLQNLNPSKPVLHTFNTTGASADSDFSPLKTYSTLPANKDVAATPISTDIAGGAFYNPGVFNDPKYSGSTVYMKVKTDTNVSPVALSFKVPVFGMAFFDLAWVNSSGVTYNAADVNHNWLPFGFTNYGPWKPTRVSARKLGTGLNVTVIAQGGRLNEAVYYNINNTGFVDSTKTIQGSDLTASFTIPVVWAQIQSVVSIQVKIGNSLVKNVLTIDATA